MQFKLVPSIFSFIILLAALGISGCVTMEAPLQEYTLARAAFVAAKEVDGARLASGYYHRALENYSRAEVLYNERNFEQAKELFIKSRIDFERAENSAQAQRKRSGEVL